MLGRAHLPTISKYTFRSIGRNNRRDGEGRVAKFVRTVDVS
jgi:hypothetical protein